MVSPCSLQDTECLVQLCWVLGASPRCLQGGGLGGWMAEPESKTKLGGLPGVPGVPWHRGMCEVALGRQTDRQTDWLLGPCLLRRVISLGSVAAAPASLHVGGSRRGHLRGRQESGRAAELPSPRRCLPWQPRAGCSAGYHRATWTLSVSVRLGAASKWASQLRASHLASLRDGRAWGVLPYPAQSLLRFGQRAFCSVSLHSG